MDPKKLGELFEGTHFRWSEKHNSWDEMLAIVELNRNEFERLEAEDPERLKRIEYCLGHLLAAKLQSRAISEFGNASDESIRQLLLRDLCVLHRSVPAINVRASIMKLERPRRVKWHKADVVWHNDNNLIPLHAPSSE